MPESVNELIASDMALNKLAARSISSIEVKQTLHHRRVLLRNRRGSLPPSQRDSRRLLIGRTDGDRFLTMVVARTMEPTTWLLITAWESTTTERKIAKR